MHPSDPTNAPSLPQAADVRAAEAVSLPDGRPALVLRHSPAGVRGLAVSADQLAAALAGIAAEVVLLCPDGTDVAVLVAAATACSPMTPVLATAADVVDAVKRVEDDRVVATVDRAGLRWAITPAALERTHLQDLLSRADPAGVVRPLAGEVTWLAPASGA